MNVDLMVYILEIIYQKKIQKGAYVINLDKYKNTGTHWVLYLLKLMKVFILIALV